MKTAETSTDGSLAHAKTGKFAMETLVGYILLVGVLLAMALILVGLMWHWAATGHLQIQSLTSGMDLFQFVWADIQRASSDSWRPGLLLKLGIAVLMLTPYVRVMISMLYFAFAERNWKYTVFTGIVFSVLTYSLFLR